MCWTTWLRLYTTAKSVVSTSMPGAKEHCVPTSIWQVPQPWHRNTMQNGVQSASRRLLASSAVNPAARSLKMRHREPLRAGQQRRSYTSSPMRLTRHPQSPEAIQGPLCRHIFCHSRMRTESNSTFGKAITLHMTTFGSEVVLWRFRPIASWQIPPANFPITGETCAAPSRKRPAPPRFTI